LINPLLGQLLAVARDAAKLIARHYEEGFEIGYKGPNDPVTSADQAANALIVSQLSAILPHIPIVAEESDPATFANYRKAERILFVDPLDGTRDFIRRNGEFAVMIGLYEEQRAQLGVVFAPVPGVAWLGSVGEGAWRVEGDGEPMRISPTTTARLADADLLVSRSRSAEGIAKASALLGVASVTRMGSAGLKGAKIADGSSDLYLSPGVAGQRWDACAIDAIVTAAGGRFGDSHGHPLNYRDADLSNRSGLLASNAELFDAALERLAAHRSQQPT
jgi:3'(2'), 5'-bisphosphate nucleotidase